MPLRARIAFPTTRNPRASRIARRAAEGKAAVWCWARVWCWDHPLDWEAAMRFRTTGTTLLGAVALAASAAAQPAPAPSATTRAVIAAARLPTVTDGPRHFRAVSVTLPPGGRSTAPAADGILYQASGSTTVSAGGV